MKKPKYNIWERVRTINEVYTSWEHLYWTIVWIEWMEEHWYLWYFSEEEYVDRHNCFRYKIANIHPFNKKASCCMYFEEEIVIDEDFVYTEWEIEDEIYELQDRIYELQEKIKK